MVLRATGPCSSTDRSTTLALVRRRSLSAARGTEEEGPAEWEREAGGKGGAAVRGMEVILGNGSDTAPSRRVRRAGAASPGAATGGRAHASQVDVATRREVPGLGNHAFEASKVAGRCPDGDRRARRRPATTAAPLGGTYRRRPRPSV